MAKKLNKQADVPVDSAPVATADPDDYTKILPTSEPGGVEPPAIDARAEPATAPVGVMLEVPVSEDLGGYVARRLSRDLPYPLAVVCRRIIDQLRADNVKLASGRAIEAPDDVLVWMLERVEAGMAGK